MNIELIALESSELLLLIDTASVYPDILVSVFVSLDTTTSNLGIASHITGVGLVDIRELYLAIAPSMREYCILWDLTEKLFEFSGLRVQ